MRLLILSSQISNCYLSRYIVFFIADVNKKELQ